MKARIKYKICLLTFKAIKYGQPKYLSELLRYRQSGTDISLRSYSAGLLDEPIISRQSFSNRCFEYCAPRMYNSLPQELRDQCCVFTFKRKLKTFIFSEAYNMDDGTVAPDFAV